MSIQLLPHTYIHLQVEGTDFIFGKRHETDIHLVIFSLSQRHRQHHHAHTLFTQTQVIILYALMTLLASKYLVSITILVSISSSRKSATVVGIGPCIIQVAIHIKKHFG